MPMGGLAHGSVHARPSAQPPIYMREIFRAHLCRVAFKHLLQPIKCHMQSFRALGKFVTPFSTPNTHIAGERGGGSPFFYFIGILIFFRVRSPCKISKPYIKTFWQKSKDRRERRERRKKKAVNSGHLVIYAQRRSAQFSLFSSGSWYSELSLATLDQGGRLSSGVLAILPASKEAKSPRGGTKGNYARRGCRRGQHF